MRLDRGAIAAAQLHTPICGLDAHIARHLHVIAAAHEQGVKLLIFPELSLGRADDLAEIALRSADPRLGPLGEQAVRHRMTIIAGAAIAHPAGAPFIGAITFHPDGARSTYRQRYLPAGQTERASAGTAFSQAQPIQGVPAALAIGADALHDLHAHAAAQTGAELYLVMAGDGRPLHAQLAAHAKAHRMDVLLAASDGSAFWSSGGALLCAADGPADHLLIIDAMGARTHPLRA